MEKIRKINYVNEVYDQLNAMICCGEISEGMRIPSEMTLAKEMNVSRPVVREALQRLRAEHKIITYQGTGSFCANPLNYENELDEGGDNITEDDFREFQEFRAAVEYGAVQQNRGRPSCHKKPSGRHAADAPGGLFRGDLLQRGRGVSLRHLSRDP